MGTACGLAGEPGASQHCEAGRLPPGSWGLFWGFLGNLTSHPLRTAKPAPWEVARCHRNIQILCAHLHICVFSDVQQLLLYEGSKPPGSGAGPQDHSRGVLPAPIQAEAEGLLGRERSTQRSMLADLRCCALRGSFHPYLAGCQDYS